MELKDDQRSAVEKLRKYKVGALFMEAGTGKTLAALELIRSVDTDYILWFTPFQTKDNLRAELDKQGGLDCEIVGIESISSSDTLYLRLADKLKSCRNAFIVCDESLKIKNYEAKRTDRLLKLAPLSEYRLILNGTPMSKNILDLWAQFQFLSPKIIGMKYEKYKNTFCKYTIITKMIGNREHKSEFIKGFANIEYLYSLIGNYVYECRLKMNIHKLFKREVYYVTEEEKEEYKRLKEFYLSESTMDEFNNNIFMAMLQSLQQSYCCSPDKFDIIDRHITDRTIIFCKFIKSMEECRKRFPGAKVMTYGKHSYGLNLQSYNRIIYFDKTFDYAQRLQTEARIFRTGQTSDCEYIDLCGNLNLEGMIDKNIEKKTTLLDHFREVGNKIFEEL